MLTWCSRAVNFNFPSCFAASRTRASPLGPLVRLGVRCGVDSCVFSLVCGFPSTTSAGDPSLLFGCFAGTAPQYDSPPPCMRDLWLIAFSLRPANCLRAATGSPGSRAWSFSACFGVFDSAGTRRTCDGARRVVAFQFVRHSRLPASHVISELHTQPTDTPVQRFKCSLATALAWFGAKVVRYAFPVRLFHSLLHAGLSRRYPDGGVRATVRRT